MKFELPEDLSFNNGLVKHPDTYLSEAGCLSWLYLIGEEFATMEDGMSYAQVQAVTPFSANVISDPPRVLDLDLARKHVAALDSLPRPTLISCRTGPRASAVAYMYSGVKSGADPEDVLAAAEKDQAPFIRFEDYKSWVRSSIDQLRAESSGSEPHEVVNHQNESLDIRSPNASAAVFNIDSSFPGSVWIPGGNLK